MSRPLRLGFSIRTFNPHSGGLQSHCAGLARQLVQRGHEVRIVTRAWSLAPTYSDLFFYRDPVGSTEVEGVVVKVLRRSSLWHGWLWLSFKLSWRSNSRRAGAWLYRRAFEAETRDALQGVDFIQHVGHGSDMIGFATAGAARSFKIPFLVQPTVHPGQCGDSSLDFLLYRQANRLLVHTDFEAGFFRQQGCLQPLNVVGNAVDDRTDGNGCRFRIRHGLGEAPVVLYLGRKHADKGYFLVREAFARLRGKCPDAWLVCMGSAPQGGAKAEGRRAEGVIEVGFATDAEKHDALAACTMLCVPSEGESFGLVFMEAGLYRKPVIGRRLPVLEELLGRREAALLVGAPDGRVTGVPASAEEVSAAILRLLTDAGMARQLGENARRVALDFTWPNVVGRFEQAYREALTRTPAGEA